MDFYIRWGPGTNPLWIRAIGLSNKLFTKKPTNATWLKSSYKFMALNLKNMKTSLGISTLFFQ